MQLDFRTPTGVGSEFRAFAEIDFFGSNGSVDLRLRHFYGQVKNVLLGQTWTTFTDVDAIPDQLDLSGPAGIGLQRQAQMRYTPPLAKGQSLALGIEKAVVQAPQITARGARIHSLPTLSFAIASTQSPDIFSWARSIESSGIASRPRIGRSSAMRSTRVEA